MLLCKLLYKRRKGKYHCELNWINHKVIKKHILDYWINHYHIITNYFHYFFDKKIKNVWNLTRISILIFFIYLFIYFTTTLLTKVIQCIKDEFGLSVWELVEEELHLEHSIKADNTYPDEVFGEVISISIKLIDY